MLGAEQAERPDAPAVERGSRPRRRLCSGLEGRGLRERQGMERQLSSGLNVTAREITMNTTEYKALYRACRRLDDGPDYRMSNYALNLINTALDFQFNAKAVNKAMCHYQENIGYSSHRKLKEIVNKFPNTERGNKRLAQHLWSNNMWTRAEFLRVLIHQFEIRGIRGQKSLTRWLRNADFERDIRGQFRTEHHSMALALFHWLCLRCGIDTIKPDVHVINFVSDAIGRRASTEESVQSLTKIAKKQGRKAYLLDSAIWHFQRDGN